MATRTKGHSLRRKNVILDQHKINRARKVLGAATETEAISMALDAVTEMARFQADLDAGLDRLIGKGGFSHPFKSGRK